jgi:chemotaxis protein CheD
MIMESSLAVPASVQTDGPVKNIVVGISDFRVARDPGNVLLTHALGSCIALTVYDPVTRVAGLLHFMLPDSRTNQDRARQQPATFADTGITLLFHAAYDLGAQKKRCIVRMTGGANVMGDGVTFEIGKKNHLAAKSILWKNGVMVKSEWVGGNTVRNVSLDVNTGRMRVYNSTGEDRDLS